MSIASRNRNRANGRVIIRTSNVRLGAVETLAAARKMRIVVGITGASGAIYAVALINSLNRLSVGVDIVLSEMGAKVLDYECGVTVADLKELGDVYDNHDLFAPISSGSHPSDGMVVIPCSMNTLGAIANGMGDSLLTRAASVALKERRPLVAVTRETPLNLIQIENMAKLVRAGGRVMPASPGFYNKPTEIWELVRSMVGRVMDNLGVSNDVAPRWQGGR